MELGAWYSDMKMKAMINKDKTDLTFFNAWSSLIKSYITSLV